MSDRILVLEPEADVDAIIEQQNAIGKMGATAGDEESKENLRAKLRSTLSKKQSLTGMFRPECGGISFSHPLCWLKGLTCLDLPCQMLGFCREREGGRRI